MTTRERYLEELRDLVDEWHAGDVDFAMFMERRGEIWKAIYLEGPALAHEIERSLRDQLPTAVPRSVKFALVPDCDPARCAAHERRGWKR